MGDKYGNEDAARERDAVMDEPDPNPADEAGEPGDERRYDVEPPALSGRWADRERELIASQVAPGFTADELDLFERVCFRTGLDPFSRQIYLIRRTKSRKRDLELDGPGPEWVKEPIAAIQTSIDGFRLIAQRSREYAGQTPPEWCAADGKWTDVWLAAEAPAAARVGVYRGGFAEALVRTVTWREFGGTTTTWKSMPALMLAKVAESQALRAAFPQELSGLYTDEEMAAADDGFSKVAPPERREAVRQDQAGRPRPKSWSEVEELLRGYDDGGVTWEAFREFVAQTSERLFGTRVVADLTVEQRTTVLWQKAAGAALALLDLRDPAGFPPPDRDAIQRAFASVLDGATLEGPGWRLGPGEEERPAYEPEKAGDAPAAAGEPGDGTQAEADAAEAERIADETVTGPPA